MCPLPARADNGMVRRCTLQTTRCTVQRPFLLFLCQSVYTRVPDARTHGRTNLVAESQSTPPVGSNLGRSGSGVPSNKSSIDDGHDTTLPTVSLGTGPQPAQIQIQITGVHILDSERRKIYHCALGLPRERVCTVSPVSRRQLGQLRFVIDCVTVCVYGVNVDLRILWLFSFWGGERCVLKVDCDCQVDREGNKS